MNTQYGASSIHSDALQFPGLLGIVGGAINAVLEEQEATIHQRETSEKEEVEIQRSNDLAEERHDELAKKVDARMTRIEVRMSSLMRAMRGTASGEADC